MQGGRLGKFRLWGFQLITDKFELVDNWIRVIWITENWNNIFEQLKLQYKLLNGIFKLKYGKMCWNLLSFRYCLKACKVPMQLMFAVEAQNLARNCTMQCFIDSEFKKYASIWRLVTIATWLIQVYPYPQSSRFLHLTHFSHISPRTSLNILIWVCFYMSLGTANTLIYISNFYAWYQSWHMSECC